MIVERLPEVLALPTEEREILAEELLNQVVLEQDKDPALVKLLRRRLDEHDAHPEGGLRWEESRARLLSSAMPEIIWKQGAENDLFLYDRFALAARLRRENC